MEAVRAPVEFTLAELWMLHDHVRHVAQDSERSRWPIASKGLNDQVSLAILACEDGRLGAYTLLMTDREIMVIDHWIRRDMKSPPPEEANGKEMLLKLFRARRELAYGPTAEGGEDLSYKTALDRKTYEKEAENADADNKPDEDPDEVAV